MYKLPSFLLFALVFSLLAACGNTTTNENNDAVQSPDSNTETADNGSEATDGDGSQAFNQQIVDNENIKVTLIDVVKKKDDIFGNEIRVKFEVENKMDQAIEVQARQVSADGKMVDETILSMSTEIAPGKIADAVLTISDFEGYDFPALEDNLEMILHVFSWDNMDFTEEHKVVVNFK